MWQWSWELNGRPGSQPEDEAKGKAREIIIILLHACWRPKNMPSYIISLLIIQ